MKKLTHILLTLVVLGSYLLVLGAPFRWGLH
jgi:hypothetical protein